MLAQDIGCLAGHDIPEHAAPHTGKHTQEDGQEMIIPISCQHGCIDSCNRKGSQSDGVKNVHHFLVGGNVTALQYPLVQPYHDEQCKDGNESSHHINRVHEKSGRDIAQYDIPEHAAAHRGGDAQDNHA